ncbi:MAG: sigma-70 family RNA polymerase sigma factor, partial [Clostridia bacterium]|nr:sigma-70 family RNA polymerase sigma factor [Clostridia bacterium]
MKGGVSLSDEEIIELFFARSEDAIAELEKKYGTMCYNIARNILGNKEDAEECVNDAYLGVWNAVPPKKPKPFATFLCRILRNLCVNRYYANTAQKRACSYSESMEELEGVLSSRESVEEKLEQKEIAKLIESFLDTLSPEN